MAIEVDQFDIEVGVLDLLTTQCDSMRWRSLVQPKMGNERRDKLGSISVAIEWRFPK